MAPAPRDLNRTAGLIASDSITGSSLVINGFALSGIGALATAIVDGSGNQITSFGGGTQYTDGAVPPAHPIGNTLLWSDGSFWQTVSTAKPLPVSAVFSASGTINTNITNASLAVTGTFWQAIQPVSGTITANAGTGTLSVNVTNVSLAVTGTFWQATQPVSIADGSLVTLGAKADAKSTATDTTAITVMQVLKEISFMEQNPASRAVTNAGTFLVQAQQSGTWNVGGTVAATQSGAWNVGGTVIANAGTNLNTSALALEAGNLATLAGAITTARMAVNPISGQAGVAANAGAVSATTQRVVEANDTGRTLVSKGGTVGASGDNSLITAGTNKLKIYAFSLSTTSTTALTCIFQSGTSGTELWRVLLQAPTGVSTGANLAVTPPAYLFATGAATLLNLNLSSANTVHWSASYYDEA